MREAQRLRGRGHERDHLGQVEQFVVAAEHVEGVSLDVFHGEIRHAVRFCDVEDRDDSRMDQFPGGSCLAQEALAGLLAFGRGSDAKIWIVLMATRRSICGSYARNTRPIAPRPSSFSIR
jgi:hypothetical protein